jgi:hypothetical protein
VVQLQPIVSIFSGTQSRTMSPLPSPSSMQFYCMCIRWPLFIMLMNMYISSGWTGDDTNSPCPGEPLSQFHTSGADDVAGCALAIAYESDVSKIQPENFTVFSVNYDCVTTLRTEFQVPAGMPPCPPAGCHCSWFWIPNFDTGSDQSTFLSSLVRSPLSPQCSYSRLLL